MINQDKYSEKNSFEKNPFIGFFVLFIRKSCCGEINYWLDWFLFL